MAEVLKSKACTHCKQVKPLESFNRTKRHKDGRDSWCYACKTDSRLKKAYGISSTDYEAMLQRQGGCCSICGGQPTKDRFDVDHDHATGEVRGLLCQHCNRGLGCFRDNTALMSKAILYLNGNPSVSHARTPDVPQQRCSQNVEGSDLR